MSWRGVFEENAGSIASARALTGHAGLLANRSRTPAGEPALFLGTLTHQRRYGKPVAKVSACVGGAERTAMTPAGTNNCCDDARSRLLWRRPIRDRRIRHASSRP